MKISVITVCRDSRETIARSLRSVASQTHRDVEHIVVDGASTDGTREIIEAHRARIGAFVSEPDRGIYDAMNKGVRLATGDVVGTLNADDHYAHEDVLARVAAQFAETDIDALLGDVAFFSPERPDRTVRVYRSRIFTPKRLSWGLMPAHPALFLRRKIHDRVGPFRTDYRIAGDFEFIVRVFGDRSLSYRHFSEVLVWMQTGGVSTAGWRSTLLLNKEVLRACRANGVTTGPLRLMLRYPARAIEFLRRS